MNKEPQLISPQAECQLFTQAQSSRRRVRTLSGEAGVEPGAPRRCCCGHGSPWAQRGTAPCTWGYPFP